MSEQSLDKAQEHKPTKFYRFELYDFIIRAPNEEKAVAEAHRVIDDGRARLCEDVTIEYEADELDPAELPADNDYYYCEGPDCDATFPFGQEFRLEDGTVLCKKCADALSALGVI